MAKSGGSSDTQVLRRVLTRRDLVLYGLVILTPTAPYPVIGIVQQTSYGHVVLCYLVAMVAMLFTALSYGKMAGAYPSAGSTYTFASQALDHHVGFLAGWSMILDYLLMPLVSIIYSALTANRMAPQVPYAVWAIVFTVGVTLLNLRGLKVMTRAGNVMMLLMSVCAVLFVGLAVRFVIARDGVRGLWSPHAILNPATFHVHPVMLGAAIASLSYIGFDAISTLAEDTVAPERDVSVATVLACLLQAIFCVITAYMAVLVWPQYSTYPTSETVILDIGHRIGGMLMMQFLSFILLVAGLASALTGQAGASRLLLGMGRDKVLPTFFAHVNERYSTPDRSIYLMGAIALAGAVALRFQLVVELLNFGAFVGFILVNLSVIRHFYLLQRQRSGWGFLSNLVCPTAGAAVCAYIWFSLTSAAKLAGFGWLFAGAVYLAVLTRGFKRPPVVFGNLSEVS